MRARRLLILLMMLLLLPQAQAERLTLYTRPGQVDEAAPFQLQRDPRHGRRGGAGK